MDEETGTVTIRPADDVPPLIGTGGKPTVVRAYYFTVGNSTNKRLAFLEKYTDEGKAIVQTQIAQGSAYRGMLCQKGRLIRKPEAGSPWVDVASAEGRRIIEELGGPDRSGPVRLVSQAS
jgi:hypothetical protein